MGVANPNRLPYRFHTVAGNGTIDKAVEVFGGGNIVALYKSPSSENIQPTDQWFAENDSMQYPASILVSDVGENLA